MSHRFRPLSTYFAGVKLRWLLDNNDKVKKAHDDGDLMFGTCVVSSPRLLPD